MGRLLESDSNHDVGQNGISQQRRLPVELRAPHESKSVSGQAVGFKYYDANGDLQDDAGQAAGTVIVIPLGVDKILDTLGKTIGRFGDTSFSFGTGTVLTKQKPFRGLNAEAEYLIGKHELDSGASLAEKVTEDFNSGEWCLDSENGIVYGVKATAGTADTVSYQFGVPVIETGGSSIGAATTYATFKKTVTTAGTRVALSATSIPFKSAMVVAETGNGASTIYVGADDVDNSNGIELLAGGSLPFSNPGDLANLYIDSSANNKSVRVIYEV